MMLAGDGERVMAFGNVELVPEKVRVGRVGAGLQEGGGSLARVKRYPESCECVGR